MILLHATNKSNLNSILSSSLNPTNNELWCIETKDLNFLKDKSLMTIMLYYGILSAKNCEYINKFYIIVADINDSEYKFNKNKREGQINFIVLDKAIPLKNIIRIIEIETDTERVKDIYAMAFYAGHTNFTEQEAENILNNYPYMTIEDVTSKMNEIGNKIDFTIKEVLEVHNGLEPILTKYDEFTYKDYFYGQMDYFIKYFKQNNLDKKYKKSIKELEEIFFQFYFDQDPDFMEIEDLINLRRVYNKLLRGEINYMEGV